MGQFKCSLITDGGTEKPSTWSHGNQHNGTQHNDIKHYAT
jgi:hypothetical protein